MESKSSHLPYHFVTFLVSDLEPLALIHQHISVLKTLDHPISIFSSCNAGLYVQIK